MADSRPGGIEKIAHLFIAGNGASNVLRPGQLPLAMVRPGGVPATAMATAMARRRRVEPAGAAAEGPVPAQPPPPTAHPMPAAALRNGAAGATPRTRRSRPAGMVPRTHLAEPGASVDPMADCTQLAGPGALQSLLSRAKVAAVLSGHMGPLAGPAAELFAKTLAREGSRVAMLYGPADLACLHRFSAACERRRRLQTPSARRQRRQQRQRRRIVPFGDDDRPCDVLLLPDWVFQFDLWPMSRGVHSICLAYGAGSEGLMSAYGALKSLVSRLGKPEELLLLPFGCNEQEETWVHERLADMCRRFLELEPRRRTRSRTCRCTPASCCRSTAAARASSSCSRRSASRC